MTPTVKRKANHQTRAPRTLGLLISERIGVEVWQRSFATYDSPTLTLVVVVAVLLLLDLR